MGGGDQRQRQQRPDAAQRRPGQLGAGSGRAARSCPSGPSRARSGRRRSSPDPTGATLLYYTTIAPDPSIQCVSVALASAAAGARSPTTATKPLVCEADQGGSIDAHPFVGATGRATSTGRTTATRSGSTPTLRSPRWTPTAPAGRHAEAAVQAGPGLGGQPGRGAVRLGGTPAGSTCSTRPTTTAPTTTPSATPSPTARSDPFTKDRDPILATNDVAAGPGHCSLFEKDGRVWMVYHAWTPGEIGADVPGRPCG